MKAILHNFEVYLPPNQLDQQQSLIWLKELHQKRNPEKSERIAKFVKKFGIPANKIQSRRSFLADFCHLDFDKNVLFRKGNDYKPDLSERSKFAQTACENAFDQLYQADQSFPSHLLHVSCTHYESPSAAQKICLQKQANTVVTHLYHMGCYAALPAIRTAQALSSQGAVDIVHTELCSLHLNTSSFSPEELVVQSLFADGCIKYSCSVDSSIKNTPGLEILSMHEIMVPNTEQDMTWRLHSDRFDMTLSKNVPKNLSQHLEGFMQVLFEKAGLNFHREKERSIFAIHPGGPKIIDQTQDLLQLKDEQLVFSNKVLRERGNMSSATLPHIWKDILSEAESTTLVPTVAFGPGLTMTGALLKV